MTIIPFISTVRFAFERPCSDMLWACGWAPLSNVNNSGSKIPGAATKGKGKFIFAHPRSISHRFLQMLRKVVSLALSLAVRGEASPLWPREDLITCATSSTAFVDSSIVEVDTNYRSRMDILWSCLSVIFACTWLSVHPNVCEAPSTWFRRTILRGKLMLIAIESPEVILLLSIRQWLGARRITRLFQQHVENEGVREGSLMEQDGNEGSGSRGQWRWTITHSHFLQMGGYVFREGGTTHHIDIAEILSDSERARLIRTSIRDRCDPEDDLLDRSKGDGLAKAAVFLHTLWFMTNCISRHIQGLEITKLELIAAGYAVSTGFTFLFWWNKPLDVQSPIVVDIPSNRSSTFTSSEAQGDNETQAIASEPSPEPKDEDEISIETNTSDLRAQSNIELLSATT
ncbi:hypothetical protein CC1G_05554 [Coprinopsis cinerea okayama7|uniref:Uncharacterized protein n=1 Tax=Coprinopsis cinerea (strain Okayama-7 / 130 / ATCC MYA-4618 / FGSC 9003) TaxID=240176 RepID=A8P1D3_COPC7|nr:hypothetical protein CC1G_05554 [Coprinopsis cinerea okayama7\|eukprot:XP_001838073.2 hypothetical protein CC1G_05554 [Coprinopsis cinerea okayama7\